ncbi:MAG: hypothetical protein KPEEDBHJ_03687 [Anaerolineales bacterium]|nr:hypothetical protein [Anaerolineales bacterium]
MKSAKYFLLIWLFLASCGTPPSTEFVPTETFTPEPTSTQTPIPSPTITPSPTQIGGASGQILFSYRKEEFSSDFPELAGELNLFTANIDGTNVIPITNGLKGNNYFQDFSPDGTKILVASNTSYKESSTLYVVDLNNLDEQPTMISESAPPTSGYNKFAKWIDNSRIVYIGKGESGFGIYISNEDGSNPINIYKNSSGIEQENPVDILAVTDTHVYWGGETKVNWGSFNVLTTFAWVTDIDENETISLEYKGEQILYTYFGGRDLAFSPDNNMIAWHEKATPDSGPPYHNYLHVAPISDINNPYTVEVFGGADLSWFPDGSKILVFDVSILRQPIEELREWYAKNPDSPLANSFEDLYGLYEVVVSPELPLKNYNLPVEMMWWQSGGAVATMDIYDISPDKKQVLVSIYEKDDTSGYIQKFGFLNLETYTFSEIKGFNFTNTVMSGVHWWP